MGSDSPLVAPLPARGGRLASGAFAKRSKSGEGAIPQAQTRGRAPLTRIPSLRFASLGIRPLPARGERWCKRLARAEVLPASLRRDLVGGVLLDVGKATGEAFALWVGERRGARAGDRVDGLRRGYRSGKRRTDHTRLDRRKAGAAALV